MIGQSASDVFDICIWLGDFNYRIEMKLDNIKYYFSSHQKIVESIPLLLKFDQMNTIKDKGNLFINNLKESEINFAPTYKLIVGSSDYLIEEGRWG